ncbi:MAG: ATP-dependent DNA helicase RecG [Planctomycetaceae bacterium]|nr:ATP-dependent DNA helicase RecG [Planctomycetaceae bacterium]
MSDEPLQTAVQYLPGVGPRRAEMLERLGIHTVEDLLWYMPRDVLDLTQLTSMFQLEKDKLQTVCGRVVDRDTRDISNGRTLTAILISSDGGFLRGTWFNQPWMLRKFRDGETVLFSGKPKRRGGRWEISNPHVQWIGDEEGEISGRVLPQYGLTEGLKMHEMRRITRAAVEEYAALIPEHLTEEVRSANQLPTIQGAITQVHCPDSVKRYHAACRRLVFDDLFEFQLAVAMRRRAWKKFATAAKLPTTPKIDARIRRLFPFDFTKGQNEAIAAIVEGLDSGQSMHRLLQADVGAGKTAIAVYTMLVAIAAGYQAVLMTPTELLANQHWQTIESTLAHSRVNRMLLTGSLTPAARRDALASIESGDVQLIVGTQALIQKGVKFDKLGVAVIDEQHKFGVAQRAHFSIENDAPHILVMTATPIPRSLCLTQFGDLDLTSITDLPPGRQKVVTSRVYGQRLKDKAWEFIKQQLANGRQAYIVCPRVEGDANIVEPSAEALFDAGDGLAGAEEVYQQLSSGLLKDFSVGLVHGQMDRDRKAAAMEAFRDGETKALVSTTVVEVGVDVPNATMMIIFQAERFGLSQLHQLRGRVGRGSFQGYCFLFSDADTPEAIKRLSALEECSDGFKIAEVDFEIRGPGDILGTRQHGQLPLRVANLIRDQKTLIEARRTAFQLVETGEFDMPPYAPLKVRVLERFSKLMALPKTG